MTNRPRPASSPAHRLRATRILGLALLLGVPGPGAAAAQDAASVLEDPERSDAARARDAGSKPLQVYEFFGIEPGMVVGDLIPGFGYNTEILSAVVGPEGDVIAAYPYAEQFLDQLRDTFAGHDNVRVLPDLSGVPDGSVDVHITIRNVHDLFNTQMMASAPFDFQEVFADAHRTLKPDGILGVVDARTDRDVDVDAHRISHAKAVAEIEAMGFELVDESDMLANPEDDHSEPGFPDRWNVDRFVLKFRKAEVSSSSGTPVYRHFGYDRE